MVYKNMSNADIKIEIEKLKNLFETKKQEIVKICDEMNKIERDYLSAKRELEMRTNIYL